jgi:hypothetical protein
MNQISEVLTTLIHYKVVVRDTMEYTLKKDSYDVNLYKEKKRAILVELNEPTPLKSIIDNSGDNGKKLEKLIRDWYEQVYGEKSTILVLADDGLRVDHAQHLAIFNGAIPIHENIESMIQGIEADAAKRNLDVKEAVEVDKAEERLYRSVAFMTLTNELVKLFGDYNQARREANGSETAASKFIGNDINSVIQLLSQVRGNAHLTDTAYMHMQDDVFELVENMTGRRDLPAGKNFGQVISEVQATIANYVKEVEPAFRNVYVPLINQLVSQAQADGNKIKPDATKAPVAANKEPVKPEGEPVEIDPHTGMPKA